MLDKISIIPITRIQKHKVNKIKNSSLLISLKVELEYRILVWPNSSLNKVSIVATVVTNMPANKGIIIKGAPLTAPAKTYSSGKKPEVPGKPTLAKDATIIKKENIGITPSIPPNAMDDLV